MEHHFPNGDRNTVPFIVHDHDGHAGLRLLHAVQGSGEHSAIDVGRTDLVPDQLRAVFVRFDAVLGIDGQHIAIPLCAPGWDRISRVSFFLGHRGMILRLRRFCIFLTALACLLCAVA